MSKNTNSKHQITKKSQNPISNDQNFSGKKALFGFLNFGHWNLFDVCDLRLGISIGQWNYRKVIQCWDKQDRVFWIGKFISS
jgi:hypothetical protein